MNSPDQHSNGFIGYTPKADRYENTSTDSDNVAMKIASLIPQGARVLDVGCGTGSVSEIIVSVTAAELIGIEPDSERAKAAVKRGLNVVNGFLTEDFMASHGPFDVIIFADVLEHLPDPAAIVTIAMNGLVPGGSVVASVPNIAHWFVRVDLLMGRFDYRDCGIMDSTHLRWFTRKTIAQFFERLGFEITSLGVTVNIDMQDYHRRIPWRWVSQTQRRQLGGALVKKFPCLFGVQHVIQATLPKQRDV